MKLSAWLDAEKGRTKATAEHFGVFAGAISQWRSSVPQGRMRELHAFTGGEVGYEDMLSDAAPELATPTTAGA